MSTHTEAPDAASNATPSPHQDTGIARAATLIAAGNIASRVLGLGREIVIANLFGATGQVSAFEAAQRIPIMLYDLLVGGMVNAVLVPVFSEQAKLKFPELTCSDSVILLEIIDYIEECRTMVTIRLARGGSKKHPFYQIIVTDSRSARNGRFIEKIGYFNPLARGQEVRYAETPEPPCSQAKSGGVICFQSFFIAHHRP